MVSVFQCQLVELLESQDETSGKFIKAQRRIQRENPLRAHSVWLLEPSLWVSSLRRLKVCGQSTIRVRKGENFKLSTKNFKFLAISRCFINILSCLRNKTRTQELREIKSIPLPSFGVKEMIIKASLLLPLHRVSIFACAFVIQTHESRTDNKSHKWLLERKKYPPGEKEKEENSWKKFISKTPTLKI